MANKEIAILIVTYNGERWLRNCLQSCTRYPTFVFDNNSSDQTADIIEKEFPQVSLVRSSKNLGFGKANNELLKVALSKGFKNVFLLNQDAYLVDGTIKCLLEASSIHSEYGILSPIHLADESYSTLDSNFLHFLHHYSGKEILDDYMATGKLKQLYDTRFTNAAGWLITRECLEKVGGFDPAFLHYGEDNNYCDRVLYHNFKIGIVPSAKMVHDRGNRGKVETDLKIEPLEYRIRHIRYFNPNGNQNELYKKEYSKINKEIIKSILKLRFSKINRLIRDLSVHKKLYRKAKKRLTLTRMEGPTFIR